MKIRWLESLRLWWFQYWRRVVGSVLLLAGVGITVYVAFSASRTEPPSAAESVAFVALAALLQLASVFLFAQNGKPDAVHAGASVSRLVQLTVRSEELSRVAQLSKDKTASEMRVALIEMSAQLRYVAEDALACVDDWTAFNPDAKRKVDELTKLAQTRSSADIADRIAAREIFETDGSQA